jgi:translation machinery-associated protein 16
MPMFVKKKCCPQPNNPLLPAEIHLWKTQGKWKDNDAQTYHAIRSKSPVERWQRTFEGLAGRRERTRRRRVVVPEASVSLSGLTPPHQQISSYFGQSSNSTQKDSSKMPFVKNLSKVQKHIANKKGKKITSLHANSRDARALSRAAGREEKLSVKAAARGRTQLPFRKKPLQPLRYQTPNLTLSVERIEFFQTFAKKSTEPFTISELQDLITAYISRDAEELAEIQAERRPGRPPSKREELLKHRREQEDKEYKSGFWIPDLTDQENIDMLRLWQGQWNALSVVKFLRITSDGSKKESSFPPKGNS